MAGISFGMNVFYRDGAEVYRTHFVARRSLEAFGTANTTRMQSARWVEHRRAPSLRQRHAGAWARRWGGRILGRALARRAGATIGFLLWACADFTFFGATNMNNLTITIVDLLVEIVHGGIAGAVIGALLPKLA